MGEAKSGPEGGEDRGKVEEFTMTLKVRNGETGEIRTSGPEEAETWDWRNPEIWRVISGWQVTSYNQLVFILHEKAKKGIREVELLEIPRFMMLSGG